MPPPCHFVAKGATNAPAVILGAGVIGLSTAYHLALALNRGKTKTSQAQVSGGIASHPIVVVDPSSGVCRGASGQCEGALGEFGFDKLTEPLAKLSYKLYSELAMDHESRIGYSPLIVHTVFSHEYDPSNPRLPYPVKEPEDISKLPPWLRVQPTWQAGLIDNGSTAARVDPPKFCSFLQEECERLGVRFLINAEAIQVCLEADGLSSVDIQVKSGSEDPETHRLSFRNLIISAGSWSPKLFSTLFPSARVGLRLADQQHVQTWLRFSDGADEDTRASGPVKPCEQVWLGALDEAVDLHVSSFATGELYAAGELERVGGGTPPLPECVRPSPDDIERLRSLVTSHVHLENRSMVGCGRAFMPGVPQGRPIMAKVPWDLLSSDSGSSRHPESPNGIYLNFGHDLDGFTLSLGSGKVMAELIQGQEPSIDLSPFKLPQASHSVEQDSKSFREIP